MRRWTRTGMRRGLAAWVTMALLVLLSGAGAHLSHHLADPECGAPGPDAHPCTACAPLHGGAVAAPHPAPAPPSPAATPSPLAVATVAAPGAVATSAHPRAPPQG
jgi:hypothetical protein